MAPSYRIVVLASGRGSNLRALIKARACGDLPIEIAAVLSDKPAARALRHAQAAGIPAIGLAASSYSERAAYDQALFDRIAVFAPDLIVLAGFMRVLDQNLVEDWRGKLVNIHPSLLPKYPGLHTHQRAIDAQDTTHGASVHFVTPVLDGGPVIAQTHIGVRTNETAQSLAKRLLPREHGLLTATLKLLAERRIRLSTQGIFLDGALLKAPLRLDQNNRFLLSN